MAISVPQLKYLEGRLSKIAFAKKQQIASEVDISDLTVKEKLEEISSGKAKLDKDKSFSSYTTLIESFTYSNTKAFTAAKKQLEDRKAKVDEHYRKILDTVVLSDIKDVAALLADFESTSF